MMSVHSLSAVRAILCSAAVSVLMLTLIVPPCVTLKWWLVPPQKPVTSWSAIWSIEATGGNVKG